MEKIQEILAPGFVIMSVFYIYLVTVYPEEIFDALLFKDVFGEGVDFSEMRLSILCWISNIVFCVTVIEGVKFLRALGGN